MQVWDWEMEDASLELASLTLVRAGLAPAVVAGPRVLPVAGRALWDRGCLPCCVRVWCVQRGLNLSWGLWALP